MIPVSELKNMTDSMLVNIYKSLNGWEWPEVLGSKPIDWLKIPDYKKEYMDECLTKADIIRPYMEAILLRIPRETIYPTPKNY
jgi:hypothetical protein